MTQVESTALAVLTEAQVQETDVRRVIYAVLREHFKEHSEQILRRAAESLEWALAQAQIDASGGVDARNQLALVVRKKLSWDDALERARSCRRSDEWIRHR